MHKQLYKTANYLGIGGLLLSVAIGGAQLFVKAQNQHSTDLATQQLESQAQITEKKADLKARSEDAYRKADQLKTGSMTMIDRNRDDNNLPSEYLARRGIAEDLFIYDKFDRCWGIWQKGKFTKDFTVCKNPNHPLNQQ